MSHNITLSHVKFTDLDMLGQIVSSMSDGRAKLDKTAKTFRTFAGQPTGCDAAIKMPGRHDVGLKLNADGKTYSPVFDPYAMDPIFKHAGATNYIGKLAQEYALQEAEYQAAQMGATTQRVEGQKGAVTLEIVQA